RLGCWPHAAGGDATGGREGRDGPGTRDDVAHHDAGASQELLDPGQDGLVAEVAEALVADRHRPHRGHEPVPVRRRAASAAAPNAHSWGRSRGCGTRARSEPPVSRRYAY